MAIVFVGASNGQRDCTIPTHVAGDLIVMIAYKLDDGTLPVVPSSFTTFYTDSGGTLRFILAYRIATSTTDVSDVWGARTLLACHVYRNCDNTNPIGVLDERSGTSTATDVLYGPSPSLALQVTDDSSWVIASAGTGGTDANLQNVPTGMILRNNLTLIGNEISSFDTNGSVAAFARRTTSVGGTVPWQSTVFEIRANRNTASASKTFDNDFLEAFGDFNRTANYSGTLSDDSLISIGLHGITGNLDKTLANDTLTATMSQDRIANASITLANDTLTTSTQLGRISDVFKTLADDTLQGNGYYEKFANASNTLGNDSVTSTGIHGLNGNFLQTLGDDSLVATASFGNNGNLDSTLDSDTLSSTTDKAHVGELFKTLADDTLSATMLGDKIGQLSQTLSDDTLAATTYSPPRGTLTQTLANDTLVADAGNYNFAYVEQTLDDDVLLYPDTNTKICCTLSVCNITEEALVCNFVNLLPTGPMWDKPKREAVKYYMDVKNGVDVSAYNQCTTLPMHSVYTAVRFYDLLMTALFPALREADPLTAYDTMSSWLEEYRWIDCFYGSCRDPELGATTPYELPTDCGAIFCEVDTPEDLQTAVTHGLIIALNRLQMGGNVTVAFINWVIEPLGGWLSIDIGAPDCPLPFKLSPLSEFLPAWSRMTCNELPSGQVQAWFDPNGCNNVGLPSKIWPGLLAAECIVRSLLKPKQFKLKRLC